MKTNFGKVVPTPYAYQLLNELNSKDSNPNDNKIDANIWDDFVKKAELNKFSDVKMGADISLEDAYKCLVPGGNEVEAPDMRRFIARRPDESKTEEKDNRFLGFLWKTGRKTVTKYDSEGRIISETVLKKNGQVYKKTIYDVDGNKLYQCRDGLFWHFDLYDSNGKKLPETEIYENKDDAYKSIIHDYGEELKIGYDHGAHGVVVSNSSYIINGFGENITSSCYNHGIGYSNLFKPSRCIATTEYYENAALTGINGYEQYGIYKMATEYDSELNVTSRRVTEPDRYTVYDADNNIIYQSKKVSKEETYTETEYRPVQVQKTRTVTEWVEVLQ